MQYWIYGLDVISRQPREPLFLEADNEDAARRQAVELGMAVEAIEPVASRRSVSGPTVAARETKAGGQTGTSGLVIGLRMLAATCGLLVFIQVMMTVKTVAELETEAGGPLILGAMLQVGVMIAIVVAISEGLRLGMAIERNTRKEGRPSI